MTTILQDRLDEIAGVSLLHGAHNDRQAADKLFCVMEAVAYVAGEKHSDHPVCTSPMITAMCIRFNDRLKTDADRDRLLKPIIPLLVGTRTTAADEQTRAFMTLDWLARQRLPIWFRLCGLTEQAELLEGLARVVDAKTADAARSALSKARSAAYKRRDEKWQELQAKRPDAAAAAAAAAYAAYAAAAADAAAAYAAAAAAAAAYAAYDADAADASTHGAALKAAKEAYEKTPGAEGWYTDKWYAARAAAEEVYKARLADDPTFTSLREEATKVQESFVELLKELCAVGRVEEVVTA